MRIRTRGSRGQAIGELALAFPIFALLIVLIVELSLQFFLEIGLRSAGGATIRRAAMNTLQRQEIERDLLARLPSWITPREGQVRITTQAHDVELPGCPPR